MKNLMNYLTMMLMVAALGFIASCGTDDDDPVIPVIEGVNVGDGFYIAPAGVDAVAGGQLKTATVDAEDFKAMDRAGFVQGYMYLVAGSYNMVEIATKAIVNTYGGAKEDVTEVNNAECTTSGYSLVKVVKDGAAFSVATDGLYVVVYDTQTSEIAFDQIETVGIIGGATPGGWGADTELAGTISATGGAWQATGVILGVDQMKFRFNCRWAIDRRLDTGEKFDNANGYSFFTNFGNTLANLLPGNEGPNMEIAERAIYTVDMSWDPVSGFAASVTKTDDAVALPTFPDVMYLVGAGTAYAWDEPGSTDVGAEMHKIAGGSVLEEGIYWKILHIEAGQGFKISAKAWASPNLGFGDVDEYDANGLAVTDTGGNMDVATSGMYMVVLNLQDDKKKVSIMAPEVYGMGDGGFTSWDEDVAAHLFTVDNAAKTLTSPALSGAGGIRSYANHAWIPAWWNAEFIPDGGKITYRNDGGDPAEVTAAVGQTVTYTFDNNTATIQ
jgi:hypothetical protein